MPMLMEPRTPLMNVTRPEYRTCSTRAVAAELISVAPRFGPPATWLARLAALLILWCQRARQRARLAELDDRLLHDIGKTRKEAIDEASKPFWRP